MIRRAMNLTVVEDDAHAAIVDALRSAPALSRHPVCGLFFVPAPRNERHIAFRSADVTAAVSAGWLTWVNNCHSAVRLAMVPQ